MKRIIMCSLCLLFTFSLCACQSKEAPEISSTTIENNSQIDEQESMDVISTIDVDTEIIKVGEHIEYGSYDLKEGDQISCDLEWSNSDGNLYIAVGAEFGAFDNGLISSGTDSGVLDETIEIKKDGTYYIYLGSQNTDTSDIKNIKGTINVFR